MSIVKKFKGLSRLTRYLVYIALAAILFLFLTMLVLPAVGRPVAESKLSKALNRKAVIEEISFNPFTLSIEIKGVAIHEPNSDRAFASCALFRVDPELVSVFKGGVVIKEITLVKPYVSLVRKDSNVYNISDLLAGNKEDAQRPEKKPFLFSISNIQIADGRIDFEDMPKHASHKLTGITLAVPLVSNFSSDMNAFIFPSFSARVNGRHFMIAGKTKPFTRSLETHCEFNVTDVSLAEYLAYVPAQLNFKMPLGSLTAKILISYVQHINEKPQITVTGDVSLASLELVSSDGKPVLSIPSFSLRGIACNLSRQELSIDDIFAKGLNLSISRRKDGALSLQTLTGNEPAQGTKPPEPDKPDAAPRWAVAVKKCVIADSAVKAEDNSTAQPVVITAERMNLRVENVSTDNSSTAGIDFSCLFNSSGTVGLQGTFMLDPLRLNLNLDLSSIDLRPAQPYVPESLKLLIAGGTLGIKGSLDLKQDKDAKPSALYQGNILLSDFALADKKHAEDFFKFTTLEAAGIRAGNNPAALDISTIKLAGLVLKPVVEPDGTTNFASVTETPEPSDGAQTEQESAEKPVLPPITIGSIALDNGRIQLIDKSITAGHFSELSNIQGTIAGLSSKKEAAADVRLSAKLNRYAPLRIAGTLSLLQEKRNADLKIMFNDIDLSKFSPYAGRFFGRRIDRGKLSLDLAYIIKDNQLTSQNRVLLDQLTLGGSVESLQATSLPVGLAISLLKNRKGEIHLDLPISGSLDDPQFSVTKILLTMLIHLVEKAAASPFSLLSAVIPGGESLRQIFFECGSALVPEKEAKKIDLLAKVLSEKMDLKLEIQGQADAEKDREGLLEAMFLRKLKVLKLKALAGKSSGLTSADEVVIERNEYEDFLSQAYRAEKFPKPRILGIPRVLPAGEMKKLMLEHIIITDDDMQEVMEQRAIAVKNLIVDSGKVSPERVFIVEPKVSTGKVPSGCCVEFKLK